MTTQMHLAAQYLAAAGISFVPEENDDSHTNLGFSTQKECLYTRPLNSSGAELLLNYNFFTLEWNSNNFIRILHLDKTSHKEVLQWIKQMVLDTKLNRPYVYKLHYDLPYSISDDFVFELKDATILRGLMEKRKLAQEILQDFLNDNQWNYEIRIWPHHFDTGAFVPVEEELGFSIGLGLAIPDTSMDDYYFYINAYKGHDAIDTRAFDSLTLGKWHNNGFKGAILPISGINKAQGIAFFKEALSVYKN